MPTNQPRPETVQLVRMEVGDYETLDHRWQVHRNRDGGFECAPRSWWVVSTHGDEDVAAPNLNAAKSYIAAHRKFDNEHAES
jgi:hypothetical protein